MSPNEQDLTFEWSRRIGGDPKHGHNELHLLRQIARARGHATTHSMNEVSALRAIAASYGKTNVGYMNELDALRAIVDGMGATPSNRNLRDMNEIDCLWAIIRAGGGASAYDADASDFFTRVAANSGTISAADKAAFNAWVVGTKADGDWDSITRGNWFVGDQLASAQVPFKVGGGGALDILVNFVEGDYSRTTGLTGNGTSKYLDTGLLANALTAHDTHLAVYNRTGGSVGGGTAIACTTGANYLQLYAPFSDGTTYSLQYDGSNGLLTVADTTAGFYMATRTASNSHVIYRNGSSIASNATAGGSLPALSLYVFNRNLNGSPQAGTYSAHAFGGYLIGKGRIAAASARMNARAETLMDAFGRGVQ